MKILFREKKIHLWARPLKTFFTLVPSYDVIFDFFFLNDIFSRNSLFVCVAVQSDVNVMAEISIRPQKKKKKFMQKLFW
jgi:hypothetical protein